MERVGHYVLDDDGEPLRVYDLFAWATWVETAVRQIAHTQIGPYRVSTAFLITDHNYLGGGDPILWETMVFASDGATTLWEGIDQRRYSTRAEALEGHRVTCQLVALEVERQAGVLPLLTELARH